MAYSIILLAKWANFATVSVESKVDQMPIVKYIEQIDFDCYLEHNEALAVIDVADGNFDDDEKKAVR